MKFQLFPNPTLLSSPISPRPLPGVNPESTKEVARVLEDDYNKHHVYFNDRGFHNHIPHTILAIWSLGADKDTIQAAYKIYAGQQRPAFESPEEIALGNFNDHLGDEKFYGAYLKYFIALVKEKAFGEILEEHLFSPTANFGDSKAHPEMLCRFLEGIIHPMIHTSYGLEFGIPGLVAEGLAQAAVHNVQSTSLIPPSLFTEEISVVKDPIHAFTVLARVLKDDGIRPDRGYVPTFEKCGESIFKLVTEWAAFDTSDSQVVNRKIEELQWANTLIYTTSGEFTADFVKMHLVTSSIFLPSIVAFLSPKSQRAFLRAYFAISIAWYVLLGKKPLGIEALFSDNNTAHPSLDTTPTKAPQPNVVASPNPNPWLTIMNQAINHPDEHISKLQRALGHYSALYGSRAAGDPEFSATELPGADKIDGTLFVRAAGLSARKLEGTGDWGRPFSG